MSKYELREKAFLNSGVRYSESLTDQSILKELEKKKALENFLLYFTTISFFSDKSTDSAWFLNIFSSSSKEEAIDNQYRFFVQTFGGPELYKEKKGKYTRLVGRHANYKIGTNAANKWIEHMDYALDQHVKLSEDREAKDILKKYFRFTAHYIVAGMEYMRDDQLSGGTQIDPGRVW
eukprot:CAMPEP_0178940472 /NCGR_PEP_ID=MMETSP0789-20121207/829_1 /TAXON_ID=3005 /ORGANISM="Rhizosolenia setigera, Strain CCMP 1694" /LENGTH=176 /DNA_ID=CAMNT_0020619517 /DNA_START=64 /DNA_END=595 /DNA_ORIENTATION=+